MAVFLPLLLQLIWGGLAGAALGAHRTMQICEHLLAKNKTLADAGVIALPGSDHWGTLAGSGPGWAGAFFFALTLGAGYAAICYLWSRFLRRLPAETLGIGSSVLFILPLLALLRGEWDVSAALLVIAVGGLISAFATPRQGKAEGMALLGIVVVLGAGFAPWYAAEEGGFTRLRDKYLLHSTVGIAANDLYYRWTLYPAEAIKALPLLTQPTMELPSNDKSPRLERFRKEMSRFHLLLLPQGSAGGDVATRMENGNIYLAAGNGWLEWPDAQNAQAETLEKVATASDPAKYLRRATLISLAVGAPLALCLLAASGILFAGRALFSLKRRLPGAFLLATVASLLLAFAGTPPQGHEAWERLSKGTAGESEIAAALASPDPVDRYYGALGAQQNPTMQEKELIAALKDSSMNVRYMSALTLGGSHTETAQKALLDLIRGEEEWYVKDRAYFALLRTGWKPQ